MKKSISSRNFSIISSISNNLIGISPYNSQLPFNGLILSSFEVINNEEEKKLVEFGNKLLGKRRYLVDHWDSVITKYRETEILPESKTNEISEILQKINENILKSYGKELKMKIPHIIDLHKDGFIDPHIDSIKFSGEIVAGVSLLSPRIFSLTLDKSFKHLYEGQNAPETIQFVAHPRRFYILSHGLRYHYNHAVLNVNQTDLIDMSEYLIDRRMSIIFRDELVQ